jgi:hypothetical protein
MIDYEGIKAMIEARMKQWEAQKQAMEHPFSLATLEGAIHACKTILQDMETAYSIHQAQES